MSGFLKNTLRNTSETDLNEADAVRGWRILSLFAILVTVATGVISIFSDKYLLAAFAFGSALLYLLFQVLLLKTSAIFFWRLLTFLLVTLDAIIAFFFLDEISHALLFFVLLYPVAALLLLKGYNYLLAFVLLLLIIAGNYLLYEKQEQPLSNIEIIIFSLSYIAITISIRYFYTTLFGYILNFKERAEYFEKEIHQRDEFLIKLSHQLRTSLSNITLINNLVHDSRMTHSQKELLDTLKVSTLDLVNNVNELVEIATPSILDYKQSILSFKLLEVLESLKDILKADMLVDKETTIKGTENIKYQIIGDPSLLRSIIINLIKGMLRHASKQNEITIDVRAESETQHKYILKFTIYFDKYPEEAIEAVQTDFYDDDKSKSSPLSIAGKLLTLINCTPEITKSENGYAVSFREEFAKDPTRLISVTEKEEKTDARQKPLKELTLLLVEDNAINQKIVLLSLEKLVRKIDVANNGKEALDLFGSKTYDVILMDIQMPVMDGITATKKIRELESTSTGRVPIIAITANALSGDRDICLAAGADEYISKPFQVEDLVECMSDLVNPGK